MSTGVLVIIGLACLAVGVWAAVDASQRPDYAWQQAGQNKTLWMVLPPVLCLLCGLIGLIPVIIYFASIRPQVISAQGGG